jgi:DNA (cytosine-5)-methyltransferase 1
MEIRTMKYISLFAGIGGFDLALNRLGHECVWANEWDKYAGQIYNNRFNTKIDSRDIRLVKTDELPDFDLLVGGFPCQAFSIAGKRMGFEDTRGTLFFEIARIIKDKRPKYFLLENVKGLLNHNRGETFQTILTTINELGYECEWQILNSKNHGVPQNRERIFISGYIRGESRPEILPIRFTNSKDIVQINGLCHFSNRVYGKDGVSPTLTSAMGTGGGYVPKIRVREFGSSAQILEKTDTAPTLTTSMGTGGGNIPLVREPKVIGMLNITTTQRVSETPKEINEFLKEYRNKPISEIATILELPKTQVEHYFRTDNSRAIPSPEVWLKLKEILKLPDNFDKEVTETYTKQIQFEQTRRIYDTTISPTLTASSSDKIAIPTINPDRENIRQSRRFKENGDVSYTLVCQFVNGVMVKIPEATKKGYAEATVGQAINLAVPNSKTRRGRVSDIAQTLDTGMQQYTLTNGYRIRRLTEIECERLQGFPDNWTEGVSSTQRYKALGNAVTVNVIYDICKGYPNEQH